MNIPKTMASLLWMAALLSMVVGEEHHLRQNEARLRDKHLDEDKITPTNTSLVQDNRKLEEETPPLEPPTEAFPGFLRCLMLAEGDGDVLQDEIGNPVSRLPVPIRAFKSGVFIQDFDEQFCEKNPCTSVGSINCGFCVYRDPESMAEQPFAEGAANRDRATPPRPENSTPKKKDTPAPPSPLLAGSPMGMPKCRQEVIEVAKRCKRGECVEGLPLASQKSVTHSGEQFEEELAGEAGAEADEPAGRRNLISYDNALGSDKRKWIGHLINKLSGEAWRATLRDFVLPGSHNSAAVDFRDTETYCRPPLAGLAFSWNKVAKCQEYSIREQLNQGIRFLDLRVIDGWPYIGFLTYVQYPLHHGFLVDQDQTHTMEEALNEVCRFVRDNPDEFVIARIKTEGTGECIYGAAHSGGWLSRYQQIKSGTDCNGRMLDYTNSHLDQRVSDLQGKVLVDVSGQVYEEYHGGLGVDGPEYSAYDGNPFQIARAIRDSGFRNEHNKFNAWSFFPAPTESQLIWVSGLIGHDGLEDWDANFQKHVWLMKNLIQLKGPNVHAILRDRATTRKNIYHVATELTLERVYRKMAGTSRWWMDAIATFEWVNEWDEKFEHSCGQFESMHDNYREDRLWKFSCRRVDWITSGVWNLWWWDLNENRWRNDPHDSIWHRNTEADVLQPWDGVLDYGWTSCSSASAIVGLGGKHDNGRADRRWWVKVAVVSGSRSGNCQWTGYINNWDAYMNHQISSNQFISRIYSYHDNHREDRRWKLCLCTVS